MKRVLSLILALAMLISLVSAVSADGETAQEYSGITVKYGMVSGAGYEFATKTDLTGIDFVKTSGFWKYHSKATTRTFEIQNSYCAYYNAMAGEWVAIEIYVPKAGKYNVSLEYGYMAGTKGAAQQAGMWILPLVNELTGKEYTDSELVAALTEETAQTTAIDFSNDDATGNTKASIEAGSYYFPQKGTYIVAYKGLKGKDGGTAENENARLYPGAITLSGGTGTVPMTLISEIDKTAIAPNGGTAKMTVKAVMSDGTFEDYTDKVTYTAKGNATVSQDGTVTGGAEGEATVTAAFDFGERVIETSQTVKVANAGIKVLYDVGYLSALIYEADVTRNEAVRQTTYDKTNGFYAFYDANFDKNNTTDRHVRPAGDIEKGTGNLRLVQNRAVAYEVYIPMAGTYTMEMKNGVKNDAAVVDVEVYLSTAAKLSENGGIYKSVDGDDSDTVRASLGDYIGKYPCYDENASGDFTSVVSTPNKITGFEIPEAGYYTIAFYAEGGYGSVGDFWLTCGTGETVPMKKSITVSEDNEAEVKILLSDKTYMDLSGATIKWKSANKSVADIDEYDGFLEVYAIGETELTAEIYFGGELYETIVDTHKVTELPPQLPCAETIYTYNFFQTISSEWAPLSKPEQSDNPNVIRDTDIFDITYDYTDGTWQWFGAGPNNVTAKNARYTGSYLRLYPGSGRWYGLTIKIPSAGKYGVDFEYYVSPATTGNANIYIVPKPSDKPKDVDSLLTRKARIATVSFYAGSKEGMKRRVIGSVDVEEPGEYVLVFEQGDAQPSYFGPRILRLDGTNNMKFARFSAESNEVTYGKSVATSITARLLDGTVLDKSTYSVLYESSDPRLAVVDENGVITGTGHGEVTITATVSNADTTITESLVINAIDDTDIVGAEISCDDVIYVGGKTKLSFLLTMQSGNTITVPAENVTYACNDDAALTFVEQGYATALSKEAAVTMSASAVFRGETISAEKKIDVARDDGKTQATYYTAEKRITARENVAKYDWAKSMEKSAKETADQYVEDLDYIYDLIFAEGLPRSTRMGGAKDPYYNMCRYCNGGINKKGSDFVINIFSRPWKTQCPDCKRLFPSNDFDKFRKLGLDREGGFDRIRALEAHRAMLLEMGKNLPDAGITDARKAQINEGDFLTKAERDHYGFGVDGGYLVNVLYTELSDPAKIPESFNNEQGLREGEDWKTWGVDDGWGYVPLQADGVTPYKYSIPGSGGVVEYVDEKHIYAAQIVDKTLKGIVDVLSALKDAYLYSGDIKYGRAGAILLDRFADVYHTYDLFAHNDIDYDGDGSYDRVWVNTEGGSGIGMITGRIDSNNQAQTLALCADAFFPALTDTRVIDYLSKKAKVFGYDTLPEDDKYNYHRNYTSSGVELECDGDCREYEHEMRRNDKSSSHDIWKNWENAIIRKNYWGVRTARIEGNVGMRQASASINAIVQDRQPETTEMFEWIYRYPNPDKQFWQGGSGLTTQLVDIIDRDGMGIQASTNYNRTEIEGFGKMADFLADYKDAGKYNLYDHPKFREMFMAFARPVTPPGHPKIGDVSSTLYYGYFAGDIEIWKNGFKYLRDTDIADELAQYIWTRNGRTTEGLRYNIFTKNPESFADEVAALVDETGAMESDLMAGWGFAILRDGGIYDSASVSTDVNNMRDFWISAGVSDGHGHRDALELNVDAYGLDLGADLGYPEDTSYTPNRLQWVDATISHNTVVVNKADSLAGTIGYTKGFPLHFDDSGMVKLMDIDAAHRYNETENYRRSLVMVKINDETSYGVDFFRVTGGNHHTYVYHSQSSKVNEVSGLNMATEPELIQVDKDGTMDYATYAGKDAAYVKNSDGSLRKALTGEEVDFETVFPVTYGQDPWTKMTYEYETMFPRGYTWLRNVRRAAEPQSSFTVDFEISDYKKAISDPKGIHLRMTQVNDFEPSAVAFAGGHVPMRSEQSRKVGYKDKFDSERASMLEYVLIEREAPEGQELDSLFTTVYEPYRNTSNIENIEAVGVTKVSGTENEGDMVRAVKVTHVGGERIDYVVYATNNSVTYNVGGMFDFRGFVGVLSTNKEGATTYRYVHDGNIIGGAVDSEATIAGRVEDFERNLVFKNYIDVSAEIEDASALAGEYIFIANDGTENAVYKIEGAEILDEHSYGEGRNVIRLDLDRATLIRGHLDATAPEKGYIYNISAGQTFAIPLSYSEDFSPEFAPVSTSLTTSAGSSISVALSASSPVEENAPAITYIGTTLPRGASINSETGVFTWKPDSSQIGENHVAITARDSDGRESTVHFTVTVYGSTTGGSSNNNSTETPSENTDTSGGTSTPAGGGGGGGGGSAAPTDKPDDTTNTDDTDEDESLLLPEKVPSEGEADEVEKPKFTDLGNHSWAEDAINTLAADGIIKGTSASTFSPAANITRADFAILLVRAFKLESDNAENFADVSASDYFANELAIAHNTGIVNGIGDNKFAPRNTITRQDMMVIVYRAITVNPVGEGLRALPSTDEVLSQYPDFAAVAPYARDAVSALIGAEIVNGKSGLIAPTDYTTRAEVAVLAKRILDYVK